MGHDAVQDCAARPFSRALLNGSGVHTVVVGDASQSLAEMDCSVRVDATSDKGQSARIVFKSAADARHVQWFVDRGNILVITTY